MASSLGEGEVLPALLESMILGYSVIADGWLDPYARLAEIGTRPAILQNWLKTGQVEGADLANPPLEPYSAFSGLATREDRVAALKEYLEARQKFHSSILNKVYTLDNVADADREWEIREQIEEALKQLLNEIKQSGESEAVPR